MPASAVESDRSSVSGRSSTSRTSRGSKRSPKKATVPQAVVEPVEERKTPFTPSMLSAGLSQLGRTADGQKPAYLTLTLAGTDLASAEPLLAFPHLQSLVLPDNRLTNIRALDGLTNLTHVDVSGNKLTQVLDLRLSPGGSCGPTNLRSADFSRNALDMLRDLSAFSRLTTLRLTDNRIERLGSGLTSLTLLKVLDLSANRLVSCRGLDRLSGLRELRLANNCLASLEPLSGLSGLQALHVSGNRLRQLGGVGALSGLRTLDVSYNRIGRLEELVAVRGAPLLGSLDVRGNPVDRAMSLRLHVVHLLPQVTQLDGMEVDSKEKVLAANMHGADAEALRLIRRKYFPNGELDDGGGAIPPLAAGLIASQAEEECSPDGPDSATLRRLDAWAASIRPETLLAPGASLITLADQLASVCAPTKPTSAAAAAAGAAGQGGLGASGPPTPLSPTRSMKSSLAARASSVGASTGPDRQAQLQRARVCWRWVVTHVAVTARLETTWDVDQPLFGHTAQAAAIERLLLGDRPFTPPPGPTPAPGSSFCNTDAKAAATSQTHMRTVSCSPTRSPTRGRVPTPNTPTSNATATANTNASSSGPAPRAPSIKRTGSRVSAVNAFPSGVNPGPSPTNPGIWPSSTHPQSMLPLYGTWAERVARLFTLLCRACELDAVPIPGYWKNSSLAPGERVEAHNHCWAGVKVNGRWRLVDPTAAALAGGHCPCYVPPDAFIYSYWPLEAAWQLLPDPLSLEVWWRLPYATLAFFAEGCQLADAELEAVNVLQPVKQGGVLPAFQLSIAAPRVKAVRLRHRLLHPTTGAILAEWPPRQPGVPTYAFQQIVAGKRGKREVCFGPSRFLAQMHQLWASLPGPGAYVLEVSRLEVVRGGAGLVLAVEGLGAQGMRLAVVEETLMLRVKVVLPPILPHDEAEDGPLHSPNLLRTPLPYASSFFTDNGCQLVSPSPAHPLEADRSEPFHVVVPGARRVGLMAEGLSVPIELPPVDPDSGTFATSLQVPRAPTVSLMAYVHNPSLESCAWLPLALMRVLPQSQHMVFTPTPIEVPEVDPDDPEAFRARDVFRTINKDVGGLVSRREILIAFRRNRQHADILSCPPRIHHHDGTFERFVDVFLQIDTNKLGTFTFNELAAYLGVLPAGMFEEEEDEEEEEYDSGAEEEGEGEEEEEEEEAQAE